MVIAEYICRDQLIDMELHLLGFWDFANKGVDVIADALKSASVSTSRQLYQKNKDVTIGGRSVNDWDGSWRGIGLLANTELSPYSHYVGLYRAKMNGKIMYIGKATEYSNGGLRKRLSDYIRDSDSSRKHASGQLMHKHSQVLSIDILITGEDGEAAQIANKLEVLLIGKHQPPWNKQFNVA